VVTRIGCSSAPARRDSQRVTDGHRLWGLPIQPSGVFSGPRVLSGGLWGYQLPATIGEHTDQLVPTLPKNQLVATLGEAIRYDHRNYTAKAAQRRKRVGQLPPSIGEIRINYPGPSEIPQIN
jgi:hypothetical protein